MRQAASNINYLKIKQMQRVKEITHGNSPQWMPCNVSPHQLYISVHHG